jgi:hypothetical protein
MVARSLLERAALALGGRASCVPTFLRRAIDAGRHVTHKPASGCRAMPFPLPGAGLRLMMGV